MLKHAMVTVRSLLVLNLSQPRFHQNVLKIYINNIWKLSTHYTDRRFGFITWEFEILCKGM